MRESQAGWAPIDGHLVRFDDSGGAGVPLLLVPGIGANVGMWAPLRRALADRRTIAYDAPGTGDSSTPKRLAPMASLATIARRLIDELDVAQVDVLGYSFGGFVAQELARVEPRVRSLTLAATTAGWSESPSDLRELVGRGMLTTPLALSLMLTPTRYHLSPKGQRLVRLAFGDWQRGDYRTADGARARRPPSALGYWWQVMASVNWSSREWLHEIAVPSLVLSGERDSIATPAAGRYLARQLGGRAVTIRGAGHSFLLAENPTAATSEIHAFLGSLDQVPTPVLSAK